MILIECRVKYLLFGCEFGSVILYLGMLGNLCVVNVDELLKKYDYIEFILVLGKVLWFNDVCCFGVCLW